MQFIPQAISAGAAAVVGEREQPGLPVPYIRVPDARPALGLISAAWFGFPSRRTGPDRGDRNRRENHHGQSDLYAF